jgi:hypothetical protein
MGAASALRNKNLQGILWNWKPVADLLPGKCGASDIDGVIERRGHFLFLEGKRQGENLPLGQRIMLSNLAKLNPDKVTVVVVTGDRDSGRIREFFKFDGSGAQCETRPGEEFNAAINRWWARVNKKR